MAQRKLQGKSQNTSNGMKIKIQHKNLGDIAKTLLRRKFIILNVYFRKEKQSLINIRKERSS